MLKKYLQALKLSFRDLYTHPTVILGIVVLIIGMILATIIVSALHLDVAGGFILSLLEIAAISYYFNWISLSRAPRRIKIVDLPEFNYPLFVAVLNAAFVLFILDLMRESFKDSPLAGIILGINLLAVVCFNVLPEVINQHQYQGLTSFSESLEFMKKRWIEWLVPMVLPVIPMLIIFTPKFALLSFAQSNPVKPFMMSFQNLLVFDANIWLLMILPLIIFSHWLMLFRRRLYDQL